MLSVLNYSDARMEGRREGKFIGERRGEAQKTVNDIKSFVKKLHLPIEQVMNILDIPVEEQELYYKLVNDPVFYEEYFADDNNFIAPSDYEDFDDDDDDDEDYEENEE